MPRPDYEKRLKAAYPIHPEVFDRLYNDWSTLVKFQRTRGVLRLMAAVIHSLWEKGDRNPLILPANIPIDDPRVQFELTRYLSDNWVPVIEKDVDGPNSLPLRLDGEVPNLGKFAACRRVARTIYLGSAPTATAANRGIEDRRIKLGCVMPGESPAIFGDALRRLSAAATYLYQDGPRYWYSTQPTVTKLAEDRAEQLKRDPDKVVQELDKRLRADLRKTGDFSRVHPLAAVRRRTCRTIRTRGWSCSGIDHPYSKEPATPAETAAKAILESRGNSPRLYRNTLVFLAVDKTRLQDLDEAVRQLSRLGVDPRREGHARLVAAPGETGRDAERQRRWRRDGTDSGGLSVAAGSGPELAPSCRSNGRHATVRPGRARGAGEQEAAQRRAAGHRFRADPAAHGARRVPLWRGDHVAIKQLVEDFGRYAYLPRLRDTAVLLDAVRDGLGLLLWSRTPSRMPTASTRRRGGIVGSDVASK